MSRATIIGIFPDSELADETVEVLGLTWASTPMQRRAVAAQAFRSKAPERATAVRLG